MHERAQQVGQLAPVQAVGLRRVDRELAGVEHVDVGEDPVAAIVGRRRLGHGALDAAGPHAFGVDRDHAGKVLGRDRAEIAGFLEIAEPDERHVGGLEHGRVDHVAPGLRPPPEQHGQRHVGRLAAGRGLTVVEVHVAVDEDEPGVGVAIAHPRRRADLQRAAPAEHDERAVVIERVGRGAPHRAREIEHRVRPDDAGRRIALGRAEEHVEVAEVARAERIDDARIAQHARRAHGAHRFADAVDRHTEERHAGHE